MPTNFIEGLCLKIQKDINEIIKNNQAPQNLRTETGYLSALTSAENKAGVEVNFFNPGNGKIRKGQITFIQRGTEGDIVHTEHDNCNFELEKSPLEVDFEITQYIGTKWFKFKEDNMRLLCEPDSEYRRKVINAELDAFMVALDKQLLSAQNMNFGSFYPANISTNKDVEMITRDNAANPMGEIVVLEDFRNIGYGGKPILIGAGNLSIYAQLQRIGCCNYLGQDIDRTAAFSFYRDNAVNTQIGNNHFIAMRPGAVQLLTYNKFKGDYIKVNDVFVHDTITDPVTGLDIDINIKYDDCKQEWGMQLGLYYLLVFLPDNTFAYADPLNGVNYTLNYKATKGV